MFYLFSILLISIIILVIQKLLSAKRKKQMKWVWLIFFVLLFCDLLINNYRIERIITDITHLLK